MLKLQNTLLVLLLATTVLSCKKKASTEDPTLPVKESHFVSATQAGPTLSKEDMQLRARFIGFGLQLNPLINYSSDFFKIVYKTTYQGKTIEASGLIGIPKNGPANPSIISGQHETRFLYNSAPSNFPTSSAGYEVLAGMGYVVVIPDYIGFGSSQSTFHPYYVREATAAAVVDMIKAGKEFLESRKFATNNRLFLVGYSEGGYATLAAQREIESNADHGLIVTGSAAGAGAFDLTTMLTEVSQSEQSSATGYIAYLLQAYNVHYGWKRSLTNFFNEPYATNIPGYFNGQVDGPDVSRNLGSNLKNLLNPTFRTDLTATGKEAVLKTALRLNSFFDWYPKVPTRLYHGREDEIVPYKSTQTTYDSFKSAGAPNVTLIPVTGTHLSAAISMMVDALPWIISIDK
jgi:alpha-beta hydrolase superfamily lysophospholipase